MWGIGVFLEGHTRPLSQKVPSSQNWNFCIPHAVRQTTTKFCMVIKLDKRKHYLSIDQPWPTTFVTWLLTRDLLVVANLLLSRVSMQCMQIAMLLWPICPSVRPSVCPMPVLCLNEWRCRHFFDDQVGVL